MGSIDGRFISMAEASSKEIREQIDKGDAVRKVSKCFALLLFKTF